jgi:uncharacterized metal-binding protein
MSSGCSGSVKGGLKWWDWRSGEKHRGLQKCLFVGPVFGLVQLLHLVGLGPFVDDFQS